MNREVHVRFWESVGLRCPALLTYLQGYADGQEAKAGLTKWIGFYNHSRPHQALRNRTPMAVWRDGVASALGEKAVDMTLRLDNAHALPTCPQPLQQQAA
jgi:putative transposase